MIFLCTASFFFFWRVRFCTQCTVHTVLYRCGKYRYGTVVVFFLFSQTSRTQFSYPVQALPGGAADSAQSGSLPLGRTRRFCSYLILKYCTMLQSLCPTSRISPILPPVPLLAVQPLLLCPSRLACLKSCKSSSFPPSLPSIPPYLLASPPFLFRSFHPSLPPEHLHSFYRYPCFIPPSLVSSLPPALPFLPPLFLPLHAWARRMGGHPQVAAGTPTPRRCRRSRERRWCCGMHSSSRSSTSGRRSYL